MTRDSSYYPKRTQRPPISVEGVTFLSYRVGIAAYALISEDGRATINRNFNRSTYSAVADNKSLGRAYRTELSAIKAATKAMRQSDTKKKR